MQLTGESLDQQIAETYEKHQAEPQNVDLARRLGALNESKEDIETASQWYQYAADLTGGGDAGLVRKVSDLKMRVAEQAIGNLEAIWRRTRRRKRIMRRGLPSSRKRRKSARNCWSMKRENESTVIQPICSFVLNWASTFLNAGKYREALPELQRARQNPNARLKAMNLLGLCYRELGMLDLAMKQLDEAAREILTMDATKKGIVYNLGLVYEQMGDRAKSLNCMKEIYEADYGYKDVAERVESSYRPDAGAGAGA